ncbi:uncharacterized protein EDB93DRAFT_733918 [Suillus bovinus]|uniref:uncharacterized protein n=1 Tax=Suillus bovinus TaxID=48563 RepID=UPI001B8663FE|nr:uncharacterized protein EDB93DRAFT_733918 [Suillus bovinus]KAG2157919.1 hypothetical protein EDB93DRAFT_733918 [Suillus bovinus]
MFLPSCFTVETLDSEPIMMLNNSEDLPEIELDVSHDLSEIDQFLLDDSLQVLFDTSIFMPDDLQPSADDSQGLLEMLLLNESDGVIPLSGEVAFDILLGSELLIDIGDLQYATTLVGKNALTGPDAAEVDGSICHELPVLQQGAEDVQNPLSLIKSTAPVISSPPAPPIDLSRFDPQPFTPTTYAKSQKRKARQSIEVEVDSACSSSLRKRRCLYEAS